MTILKKLWREAMIVILLLVCFMAIRGCKVEQQSNAVLRNSYDSAFNEVRQYRTKNGDLVHQVNTLEITSKQLKEDADRLGFERDELKNQVGALNRLVAHWKGKADLSDTIIITLRDTVYVDSSGAPLIGKTFDWNNRWMRINGFMDSTHVTLGYSYSVEFALTAYRKRKEGFWKPPGQLVADIKFSDPSIRVTEFRGFVIQEPKKQWYETRGAAIGLGALIGLYLGSR